MKGTKGSVDEGGVRSVFFIRWTGGGIPAGTVVKEIAGAIDLLPTLCALSGVKRIGEKPLDGRDLSPLLLRGRDADWASRLIFSHQNGNVSARSQQYRLECAGSLIRYARGSWSDQEHREREARDRRADGESC
jgi:arylsulfatase A-like enzyme